jgi:hypothetical protein
MSTHRVFGRPGISVPGIWWQTSAAAMPPRAQHLSNFAVVHAGSGRVVPDEMNIAISVNSPKVLERNARPVHEELAKLGRKRCEAVILDDATPTELKGGRLFHRLSQLRDEELTSLLILSAPDSLAAEWMVENTAAHGVIVPFSRADQSAGFRVLDKATDVGCALLARAKDLEDIRLILAEPRITVAIIPAPASEVELEELERIVRAGPDTAYRDEEWEKYRASHEPPAKLRSSHPPEYGA